jgi:hypothetical protein
MRKTLDIIEPSPLHFFLGIQVLEMDNGIFFLHLNMH